MVFFTFSYSVGITVSSYPECIPRETFGKSCSIFAASMVPHYHKISCTSGSRPGCFQRVTFWRRGYPSSREHGSRLFLVASRNVRAIQAEHSLSLFLFTRVTTRLMVAYNAARARKCSTKTPCLGQSILGGQDNTERKFRGRDR